jgi:CheY-like chemotaxis protein
VLFVDDDRAFLNLAQQTFNDLSKGAWDVVTASDASSTSVLLQKQGVDLIVLDVRMPDISGLQLMGILQKEHPKIPKVFLAGVVEEDERMAGLESGAALFLEKPADYSDLQSLYATLSELLQWREKKGPSAAPRASILDLVKLECSAKNSRIFEIYNNEVRGQIFIQGGDIVHAASPGRRGQSAFTYLTTLLDAEFNLRKYEETPERSIVRQWEFLYLEAVQLREQLAQAAEEAKAKASAETESEVAEAPAESTPPRAESPGSGVDSAAAAPAVPPEPKPKSPPPTGSLPKVSDEDATRALFRRPGASSAEAPPGAPTAEPPAKSSARPPSPPPASPAKPAPAAPEEPLQLRMLRPEVPSVTPAAAKPAPKKGRPRARADKPAVRGPRIQELLVCSYSAEILYEWQCPQAEIRLKLVEAARDRSERLTTHLPVGPVDRLELQATQARLVLRFQEDGAVLLRSASGQKPGAPGSSQFHQSIEGWLARQSSIRGLLASGVIRPRQTPVSQSVDREFKRDALAVAWQGVQELLDALPEQGIEPWQLRWIFERAQLYVVCREDGKALAIFLAKDPTAVDAAAVEKVFKDFKAVETG